MYTVPYPHSSASPAATRTCGREEGGGTRQVVGVMDRTKKAGARGSTEELRLEPEVQLVRVDLHLLLKMGKRSENPLEKTNSKLGGRAEQKRSENKAKWCSELDWNRISTQTPVTQNTCSSSPSPPR